MNKAEVKALEIGDEVVVKASLWFDWTPPNPAMNIQGLKGRIVEVVELYEKTLAYIIKFEKYDKELILHGDSIEECPECSNAKLKTKDKLRGHAFKGTILKNTTGMKNQELIDKFQGSEFLLDSFSGKYVYGFPVGHFGDRKYRFQFDLSSARFYMESQEAECSVPVLPLHAAICYVIDNWGK